MELLDGKDASENRHGTCPAGLEDDIAEVEGIVFDRLAELTKRVETLETERAERLARAREADEALEGLSGVMAYLAEAFDRLRVRSNR